MKRELTLEEVQAIMPSAQYAQVRLHEGRVERMFQVSFRENLRYGVAAIQKKENDRHHIPSLWRVAPPIAVFFPTAQPEMDAFFIEDGIAEIPDNRLLSELGISQDGNDEQSRPAMVLMVAGQYLCPGGNRKFLIKRYERASHAILSVFWRDEHKPVYFGVNSAFGRTNHAVEFYRTAADKNHYGCDVWILRLDPSTVLYDSFRKNAEFSDQLIIGHQAETALRGVIKNLFIKSGVVDTFEKLPGWCIDFDDKILVVCIDNCNCRGIMGFEYSKEALDNVRYLLGLYGSGRLDLKELYDLIEHDST